MPLPILQEEPDYNSWHNAAGSILENTSADAAAASYEQGSNENLTMDFARRQGRAELEGRGGKILSPNELNQKYGSEGIFFKEPTSDLVAEDIATHRREQMALQQRIGTGPDGLWQWTKNAGAGAAGSFLHDPVSFGLYTAGGAILGPALGVTGKLGAGAAGIMERGAIEGATLAESVAGTAVRSVGTGAIAAVPQTALEEYQKHLDQFDVSATGTMEDYVKNVAMNAVFDVGVHVVGKGAKALSKRGWNWLSGSNEMAGRDKFNMALEQAYADKRPDPSVISALIARERTAAIPDSSVDYSGRTERQSFVSEDGKASGRFFYGTDSLHEDFGQIDPTGIKPFESNYGDGYYVTDSAARANSFAASKFNSSQGNIFELNVNEAKIIHADNPVPGNVVGRVKGVLVNSTESASLKKEISSKIDGGATIKEIFDLIHELAEPDQAAKIIGDINTHMKEMGYDGYSFGDDGKTELMLFGNEKVEAKGTYASDPSIVPDSNGVAPDIQDSYNATMNSKESDLFYDKTTESSVIQLADKAEIQAKDPLGPMGDPALKEAHLKASEDIKALEESGKLSAEDKAILDDLNGKAKPEGEVSKEVDFQTKVKANESAIKAAVVCVGG
jgi:hypothetical protein